MAGDDLCRTLVQQAGRPSRPRAGTASCSPTGSTSEGEDWQDRLRSWVPRGCDAWIVQREVQDVTQYAELWLRDSGDHRAGPGGVRRAVRRMAGRVRGPQDKGRRLRLDHLAQDRAPTGRRSLVEEWPHPVEQPLGDAVRAHFERQDSPAEPR